jgi:oligopeptide/dipeptide ABC transporter ATP-binding protein
MAQRVVIALALARSPKLIVADEPTASLDSTLRTRILDLITRLASASGAALLMVSHDLEAIARYCDVTAVMYGGRIVELAETAAVFAGPQHPYTAALLSAAPGREAPGGRLYEIPGAQQVRYDTARGCVFADRCTFQIPRCTEEKPTTETIRGHNVACHRAAELALDGGGHRP